MQPRISIYIDDGTAVRTVGRNSTKTHLQRDKVTTRSEPKVASPYCHSYFRIDRPCHDIPNAVLLLEQRAAIMEELYASDRSQCERQLTLGQAVTEAYVVEQVGDMADNLSI